MEKKLIDIDFEENFEKRKRRIMSQTVTLALNNSVLFKLWKTRK